MKYIKLFENIEDDKKLTFLEDAFIEIKELCFSFKIKEYKNYHEIELHLYKPLSSNDPTKLSKMIKISELRTLIYKNILKILNTFESNIENYDINFNDENWIYIKIY